MLLDIIRNGITAESVIHLGIYIIVILFSLSFHEMAHGYVAYRCGDATAKNLGRITLNPLVHLNLIGTIMMLVFGFGYATPVPINTRNFNHFKRDLCFVSFAGPVSNLLLAFIGSLVMRFGTIFLQNSVPGQVFMVFCTYFVIVNASLAIFNILPIPPLDGSRIVSVLLPGKISYYYLKYERQIMLVLFALLYIGFLDKILIVMRSVLLSGIFALTDIIMNPVIKFFH